MSTKKVGDKRPAKERQMGAKSRSDKLRLPEAANGAFRMLIFRKCKSL